MTGDQSETAESGRFAYCSLPPGPIRQLGPEISGARLEAVLVSASKWVNGTILRFHFFDRDTDGATVTFADGTTQWRAWTTDEAHRELVRHSFGAWMDIDLGLEFVETSRREDAEVRIGFMRGDGSWSYVGRDVLGQGVNERTMNFGWDLMNGPNGPDRDTTLHEIGHTLGLPHEHQNPFAGLVWDEERVYAELAKEPNSWSREKTHWNIIRKIPADTVQGSSWDPDSIMHYPFEAGLILTPEKYLTQPLVPAGGLSPRDITWVRTFYPAIGEPALPELAPLVSTAVEAGPGKQSDFAVRPPATRKYRFSTFGESDTVMVLFEEVDGTLRYRAGDDDSGVDRNASLEEMLYSERQYVLRVRVNYSVGGQTAVMMW